MTTAEKHTVISSLDEVIPGSHYTTVHGDKIVIHDLELFTGFDPDIDDEDDSRMAKYDLTGIARVALQTAKMIGKGARPQVILGHNADDPDPDPKPSIGVILQVRSGTVGGVPAIIGDVEMSRENFDLYIANNAYVRRSAEIWSDGWLSELALLGAQTPSRPLPDTRFQRAGLTRELFCRSMPGLTFGDTPATRRDAWKPNPAIRPGASC